ncbi:MAG: hypothetical protein ACRD0F_01640, partial [Acidimicrobiales bacterium]
MSPLGALHQFVPHLNPGAIATHLLGVQDALRQHGLCSEVFAGAVDPAFAGRARPYLEYGGAVPAQPGDALLYHVALGSPMAGWLAARPETLVLDHHNITPARYFAAWDWRLAGHARKGRRELETLAPRADFGWADSAFNQRELIDAGCRRTAVVPILIDLDDEARAPDPDLLARLIDAKAAGGADWVFVGRVTPNKAQHDIVKAFAAYRRLYDPGARLRLVGDPSPPRYFSTVARFVEGLGLGDAVT